MNHKHLEGHNRLRNVARFLPTGVWFVLVTYFSLVSGESLKSSWLDFVPYRDKVIHTSAYFLAAVLMLYSLGGQVDRTFHVGAAYTIVFCVAWGVMIEYMQRVMSTGRNFDVFDIIANIIGALVGVALFKWFFKKKYYGS